MACTGDVVELGITGLGILKNTISVREERDHVLSPDGGRSPTSVITMFKKDDGSLYREQVMGTKGFSGTQSILYHHHLPTAVSEASYGGSYLPEFEEEGTLRHRHFFTDAIEKKGDALNAREYLLGNSDLLIGTASVKDAMSDFYRNGDGDELLFIHYGAGKVETMFGTLSYGKGDYIIIPIGTIHRNHTEEETKILVVESFSQITTHEGIGMNMASSRALVHSVNVIFRDRKCWNPVMKKVNIAS